MNIIIKIILLVIFCMLLCNNNHAQSIESISGYVKNNENQVLLGNVIVLSAKDSTVITGTSFFENEFLIDNLKQTKVILKFTSLAFKEMYMNIEYQGQADIDLGIVNVLENKNELDEVVLTSKSSLVKERADGTLEVNIANTTLATSTSVDEILRKSPGIVYNTDGEISVFGKGNAIIFLNGIRIASERLSTLSPTNIEKVEIINNPGPRYDAEGNAVINIITKINDEVGNKGVVKNYYTHNNFSGYDNRTNIDYSYVKGKWSINSSYGFLTGNDRHILTTTRSRKEPIDMFTSDLETDWQYDFNNFSNYTAGVQYNINKENYISFSYIGAYESLGGNQISKNIITDTATGIYQSNINVDQITSKNTFNINYYSKIDSLGSNIFIGGQYSSYNEDFENLITENNIIDMVEDNARINNIGENKIDIVSFQFDYTKTFPNTSIVEFGGKLGYVNINSNTDFFNIQNDGSLIIDEEISNTFTYLEKIPALYVNYKGKINTLNYSLGLRSELTTYDLTTSNRAGSKIENEYIDFFPNASINTTLSDHSNVYLSYTSRINRPRYSILNPFVVYQDALTSIQGNPNLQPSKVHAIEIGGTYNKWGLKAGYNYTIDPIDGGAFQSEENPRAYILQRRNVTKRHSYFISLSKNVNLKWWRSSNTITTTYDELKDNTGVFDISNNKKPYYYLYSQNSFDIKDWVTIFLTGWYLSEKQDGLNSERDYSSVNIGLEKKLFNKTTTFNIDFNDIFYKVRADGNYRAGITDIVYANIFNTRYIRFSLSYNFGKLKNDRYKNVNIGEPETKRAN
ncbi:outer membrane beta-barrel family protein [Aquimarina algicola]|uniref:TonB-dependent receptor n=1 Tax=Aquimarina algicola TaxID=2589995 RepID=A0A504JE13_9FLAO|nr:outer membrane beta-barrel family protein [Aquimarina algicola]TPN88954.1 TonB-dependent receptor [Aquimarina algicola]